MKKKKWNCFKIISIFKTFWILLVLVVTLLLGGCGSSKSGAEKEAADKMKEGISYYSDEFIKKIPEISEERDTEKIIKELESAIDKSKDYIDLYMTYIDNSELSEEYRNAAMNLKTAYYGIQTTALEPLLEIMQTDSGESPDYPTIVYNTKEEYIDKADELLK